MNELVFEIWRDEATGDQEMALVSEQSDNLRKSTMPCGIMVHAFRASSDFRAFQANYNWNGWGEWKPEHGQHEQQFTDEDVEAQRRYLAQRNVG